MDDNKILNSHKWQLYRMIFLETTDVTMINVFRTKLNPNSKLHQKDDFEIAITYKCFDSMRTRYVLEFNWEMRSSSNRIFSLVTIF